MPELGTPGSVRGVLSNGHPYRDSFRRWWTKLQRMGATAPSLTLVPISVGAPATAPAIRLHSPGGWRIELATANPACLADLVRQLP